MRKQLNMMKKWPQSFILLKPDKNPYFLLPLSSFFFSNITIQKHHHLQDEMTFSPVHFLSHSKVKDYKNVDGGIIMQ